MKERKLKQEEIKKDCEKMCLQIKQSEQRLKELRTVCEHPKTFEGNWSERVGSIMLAEICSDCGVLIRYK